MAIYRNVNMSFWTDTKVVDDYTPEDKYFMLWALTNPYTNIIGCYEVSTKQIARDLGYDPDSNIVENLIKRFTEIHKTIEYDYETKELLIINWNRYNWSSSPKLDNPLLNAIEEVKSNKFHDLLATIYNSRESINKEGAESGLIAYRGYSDEAETVEIVSAPIVATNVVKISEEILDEAEKYGITITTRTNEKKLIEQIKEEKLKEEFEIIWKAYPKKRGKAAAFKSYIKAKKNGATREEIWYGLQSYLEYIKLEKVEDKYIQHGSTWFNQEGWNDDYTVRRQPTTKDFANSGQANFEKFRRK